MLTTSPDLSQRVVGNEMHRMNPRQRHITVNDLNDMVALGRSCAKNEFPNPTRKDCPDRSLLREIASDNPTERIEDLPIQHLVHCSPCFRDYQSMRRGAQITRRIQVTAAALILVGLIVTGVLFVKSRTRTGEDWRLSHRKEVPETQADTNPVGPVPPIRMEVNLATFTATRGVDGGLSSRNRIHLPPRSLHIDFRMPVGMEPGEYTLQVKNSSGVVLAEATGTGHLRNGATWVEIVFDLSGAATGHSVLMVRPPGLSWRTFPAVIE